MSVLARIKARMSGARLAKQAARAGRADRLRDHDAVDDVVARLLAAAEPLTGEGPPRERGPAAKASSGVTFLFSSLRRGQGASTVAAAVARRLAETGRRTLLAVVDDAPGAEAPPGAVALGDVVDAPRPIRLEQPPLLTVLVPPRLTDLPASARDPRSWLDGFDVLIIDAPPLTDGLTRYWAPGVNGVVFVLDGEKVAVRAVIQAREDLERLGGRLLGVVLNRYRSRIPRWLAPYFVYG